MEPTHDLVIAGAGPVGLSLALGLGRAGKSVLVLESKEALSEYSKAPVLWPRTLEVLESLGVIGEFLSRAERLSEFVVWNVDKNPEEALIRLSFRELSGETPFPFALVLPQPDTERILLDAVRLCPRSEVKFSATVTGLEQFKDRVVFTYLERGEEKKAVARCGAGCDGAHSQVRELLGYRLEGFTYSLRAALADIRLAEKRDYRYPRLSTAASPTVGIRIAPDLWRLILLYGEDDDFKIEPQIRAAVRRLFSQESYTVAWESQFKLHRRLSTGFAKGRIALAGDAAHLNSPVGGQGMNAGIQDTVSLSRAYLELLNQENEPLRSSDTSPALRDYAETRQRAIEGGVNRFTDRLTAALTSGHIEYIKVVMSLAQQVFAIAPIRHRFLRRIAML